MPKPSFFQKLLGISNLDEETKIETEKEKEPTETKLKKIKTIKKDKPMAKKEESSLPKKQSEDWLSESEGQLTIDVYQTPNEVVIKSTIAGVKPEDIDITMTNDMITIKGRRQKDEEVAEGDYYYQECYWGSFSRSVILPVDVEVEKAQATMKNGILTIRLPKAEKVKTKKIEIKTE